MTLEHAARMYFDERPEATKKRVQKLKAAGYVGERPRRPRDPAILFLTRRAHSALIERGELHEYPKLEWASFEKRARVSDSTVRHELAVMSVKSALTAAINRNTAFRVAQFSTWPVLFQFEARCPAEHPEHGRNGRFLVRPDAFFRVSEGAQAPQVEHAFFIEVDRSTETQDWLAFKTAAYFDFFRSGGFAERYGHPRSAYAAHGFRLLFVFRNAERRDNAAERILRLRPALPNTKWLWLTTFGELIDNPAGAIWMRVHDYVAAESQRGIFIREATQKRHLLEKKRDGVEPVSAA